MVLGGQGERGVAVEAGGGCGVGGARVDGAAAQVGGIGGQQRGRELDDVTDCLRHGGLKLGGADP